MEISQLKTALALKAEWDKLTVLKRIWTDVIKGADDLAYKEHKKLHQMEGITPATFTLLKGKVLQDINTRIAEVKAQFASL